jgi:hypothetical protein
MKGTEPIPWVRDLFSKPRFVPSWGSFGATSLSLYFECPRRYYFDKVRRIDFLAGEASILAGSEGGDETDGNFSLSDPSISPRDFGTLVHRVLEELDFTRSHSIKEIRYLLRTRTGGLENRKIQEAARDIYAFLQSDLGRILRSVPPQGIQKEQPFRLRLTEDGFTLDLTGTVDLFFPKEDGFWTVVDYKYEKRREYRERYATQLKIYALALSKFLGSEKIRTVAAYLKEDEADWEQVPFDERDKIEFQNRLIGAAGKIMALGSEPEEAWLKIQSDKCRVYRCPYLPRCHPETAKIAGNRKKKFRPENNGD